MKQFKTLILALSFCHLANAASVDEPHPYKKHDAAKIPGATQYDTSAIQTGGSLGGPGGDPDNKRGSVNQKATPRKDKQTSAQKKIESMKSHSKAVQDQNQ